MLNFIYVGDILMSVSESYVPDAINRNDFQSFEDAVKVATDATDATGTLYIPVDQGSHTSPRYDVIAAPQVGSEVSRAFNGDYYPAGKIVKISKSLRRVETEMGVVFYRVRQSASWRANGTWYMSPGRRSEYNPSF